MYAIIQLNDGTFVDFGPLWSFEQAERMADLIPHGAYKAVLVWEFYKRAYYPHAVFTLNSARICTQHEDYFGPRAFFSHVA